MKGHYVDTGKVKISGYKEERKTYSTDSYINFTVNINGKTAKGTWSAKNKYISYGGDLDELVVDGKRIKIFDGGGSYRSYEMSFGSLKDKPNKKPVRFVGMELDTSHLGDLFIHKIKRHIENENEPVKLTKEFIETFGLKK